jgi:hypothetical protein
MSNTRGIKDVVGVYTQNFIQVFSRARPIKATVRPSSRLMEHPLETGAFISDHRIILQTQIELSLILQSADYRTAYREITQLFLNATILMVQTRSGIYSNQVIMEPPVEEDPDMYDTLSVALKLKQVQFSIVKFGLAPAKPINNSTVQRGQQTTTENNNPSVLAGFVGPP